VSIAKTGSGQFALMGSDTDRPEDAPTWSVLETTCAFLPTVATDGVVSWTCDGVETCSVELQAQDDGEPTLSVTGQLGLQCTNSAPAFTSVAPDGAEEGTAYHYDVVCADPDGDALSLAVGGDDTCGGAIVDNADGTGDYEFTPGESQGGGSCVAHITCDDDAGPVSQRSTLSVAEVNEAPVFATSPPVDATEAATYSHTIACSDPDGDLVTLSVAESDSCGGALSDSDNGAALYTVTPNETQGGGTCVVAIASTDGEETAVSSAVVTVAEDNTRTTPPRIFQLKPYPERTGAPRPTASHSPPPTATCRPGILAGRWSPTPAASPPHSIPPAAS